MSNSIVNLSENVQQTTTLITESSYSGMNKVFDHTEEIIAGMQQGEKITVGDLTDKVHAKVANMSSGHVTNLVHMFLKECKDVSVETGRGGGVYKGGKPQRVDTRLRCHTCNQVIRHTMKLH